jgi:hypothetical protein
MYSRFLILAVLAISIWGCNTEIEDENTAKIDELIGVVEGAQKAIQALDSTEVARMRDVYSAYYDFFSNEYDDISNKSFYTSSLADMAECYKRLNGTTMGLKAWEQELDRVHTQLTTLRHDYANGLVTADDFEVYLGNEASATNAVNNEITKNVGMVSMCMRNHKALSAKLDSARTDWLAQQSE